MKNIIKNENIIAYDEKYIHTWPLHPYDNLVDIIKKNRWDKLVIGLEMDSHYFTAYCYEKIRQGLPNATLKDSERLVNWTRVVKSNAEIELMKSAALISEKGLGEVVNFGSNFEISIGDTANLIAQLMNVEIEVIADEIRIRPENSEVDRLWCNNNKAKTLFNWHPNYHGVDGFKRGLTETIEWFKSNSLSYKSDIYNI